MDICFGGKSTRDKLMFMSYLGLILSGNKSVVVKMNEKPFFTSSDSVFFGENLTITNKDLSGDIVIREGDEIGDMNFFVYDLLASFPKNRKENENTNDIKNITYIFMNNTNYSKINEKYLSIKYGVESKKAIFLPLDEFNISKNIENCFEEKLDMKGMSRSYKKLLLNISASILGNDEKESKMLYKLALRGC